MLVKLLQPLRIVHVGLAARNVFDVAGIYQQHLKASCFENLEDRNPVHACRFHRDGRNAHLDQPLRQAVEVAAEGSEGTHRPFIAVGRYCDHVSGRADIDSGC